MPELPEVETIRTDLAPLLEGQRVEHLAADFSDPRYLGLCDALGRTIRRLSRRGKYLLADLGDREWIMHLGMTGQLAVGAHPALPMRHLRVTARLSDGSQLLFNDPRRFGRMAVVVPGDYSALPTLAAMGPEPLTDAFDPEAFAAAVAPTRAIKPLLLSQRIVAGLGNIYVDEALYLARLHPAAQSLDRPSAFRLWEAIREVLALGVTHRGTTFKDYRDGMGRYGSHQDFLRVYDREGEPCGRCGGTITKTRLGGRGTYYCPTCQPPA